MCSSRAEGVVIRQQPVDDLSSYVLIESRTPAKDYDSAEDPRSWPRLFDTGHWAMFSAWIGDRRAGGAISARDTAGVDMLEGRSDLAVLWDIRVAPAAQRTGVGRALFDAVEQWARAHGCTELKVETQDNNAAACRFYAAMGCRLAEANPGVYDAFPDEVQLIWRKPL